MERLLQDIRYAVRSLLRQPAFAATAILTLALGIGATTAIFSAVDAIVLRPLPFPRADRIMVVGNYLTRTGSRSTTVSAPDFHDWESQNRTFSSMAYYIGSEISVTVNGTADYASVYRVTPGFFDVLGAHAQIGRLLTRNEQQPGGPSAVVITDAFWRRQFSGDRSAVGSTIKFNDTIFTIAGLLDRATRFPPRADIYMPAWRLARNDVEVRAQLFGDRAAGRRRDGGSGERRHDRHCGAARVRVPEHEREQADVRHPAAGPDGRRNETDALRPVRRRRPGPPHRVRERGQPAASALHGPRA
jgi:hypothetical protein